MYKNEYFLYRFIDSFCRHWRIFLLTVVCITGVVGGALYSRSKAFTASATTQIIANTNVAEAVGQKSNQPLSWTSPADQNSQHFRDLLRDDLPGGFVETALRRAQLTKPINVDPAANDKRLETLMQRLRINSDSGDVFTMSLVWDDAQECERLLSAFQSQYIDEAGATHQTSSIAITQFLNSEIEKYEKRMRKAEGALIAYKKTHSGELPDAQTRQIEQLSTLRTELNYLRITAQDNTLRQKALAEQLSRLKPVSVKEATIGSSPIQDEIRSLEETRRILTVGVPGRGPYRSTSEPVVKTDARIAELQKKLDKERQQDLTHSSNVTETKLEENPQYREVAQQLTQANIDKLTQSSRMALLQQQINKYETDIAQIPAAEKELTDKTRDYTILKKQLEDLLERREQANLKASLDKITESSTFKPIGRIYAESTAGIKKTILTFVGSAAFALLVGFSLVLLCELLDPSLRYATDTYRLLNAPVLVVLPEAAELRYLAGSGKGPTRQIGAPLPAADPS